MEAPFQMAQDVLTLDDVRTYSASLGITVKGSIDLRQHSVDLQGTVIPAYFFNTLLGRIPLVGRLFSPEAGGGLLAATYSIRGPIDKPAVGVNPLAALTPGVLRSFFDLFQASHGADATAEPAAPAAPR
jgi:hypothetical protein